MSTTHTYIGGQNYNETVTINESINLAKFEVGGVAPGQVTGAKSRQPTRRRGVGAQIRRI